MQNHFFADNFLYNDPETNPGVVISPMISNLYRSGTSIKLVVNFIKGVPDAAGTGTRTVSFTCDGKLTFFS